MNELDKEIKKWEQNLEIWRNQEISEYWSEAQNERVVVWVRGVLEKLKRDRADKIGKNNN